jgi:uncharacterized membrane protein YphA (DoxX/SURF4 family)
MKIGVYIFGISSVVAGILDLIWGEFESAHQPLQAWGDHIPGATVFAYIAAIWLIAGGAAMLWQRSAQFGAAALTILYGIFVLFPLPRFVTAPQILGYRVTVYIGVMSNVCEQIILFAAAAIAWQLLAARDANSQSVTLISRWIFGLCPIFFGIGNLTAIQTVVVMIPSWMPLGGTFWAVLTAIAFTLAGLAIVSGVLDVLAAWLLGLMLLVFSVLVLVPLIFAFPHDHTSWGGNAYNLTVMGAAWIAADWLATRRKPHPNLQRVNPTRQFHPKERTA